VTVVFAATLLVWIGAVYSRYHYAVDGLAAVVVSTMAIVLLALVRRALGSRL